MAAVKIDADRRKQIESDCVSEAWKTGATSAVTALGLAGAAVGGANYFPRIQDFSRRQREGRSCRTFHSTTLQLACRCYCQEQIRANADVIPSPRRCLQHSQCFGCTQSLLCTSVLRRNSLSYWSSHGEHNRQRQSRKT